MWEIEFYEKPNGRCPISDFLNKLSPKDDLPFIEKALDRLEKYGHGLQRPYVDLLRDDIWELRVRTRRGQIRILYFYFFRTKIIITHGIIKKAGRVPDNEIEKAIEYRKDYLDQNRRPRT